MAGGPEFLEWMVNKALFNHLSDEQTKRENIEWFFALQVDIGNGANRSVEELCGFRWQLGDPDVLFEKGLKIDEWRSEDDRVRFNEVYSYLRPDFRFHTKDGSRRLFIEGKGIGPSRDAKRQASTYFNFLSESGSKGALIYLVPKSAKTWVPFLRDARPKGAETIETGVVYWDDAFLARISAELLHVVTESLIPPMKLVEKALKFRDQHRLTAISKT